MYSVHITDFADWRNKARACLQRQILPEKIDWQTQVQDQFTFGEDFESIKQLPVAQSKIRLSARFLDLAKSVAPYQDQSQWHLLYSLAFQLLTDKHCHMDDALNSHIRQLNGMQKRVSRDKHKMKAFVRFKKLPVPVDLDKVLSQTMSNADFEYFVAWFEPENRILSEMAAFFTNRFYNMNWSIFTPYASLHWIDKQQRYIEQAYPRMHFDDETEALWLQYYASIFNPARLKLKAMQNEMPKKYWHNLPEARLIHRLSQSAQQQTCDMINQTDAGTTPKAAKSKWMANAQFLLRRKAKMKDGTSHTETNVGKIN